MDKLTAYRKIGIVLLSIWVIVWVILIFKYSIPRASFQNFIFATIMNVAFNPCGFIGAVLLDLAKMHKTPVGKPAWFTCTIIYGILFLFVFGYVLWVAQSSKITVEDRANVTSQRK